MIINSDDIAVLQKEIPLPITQNVCVGWDICCDLSTEEMAKIIHPDYLTGEEFPYMLIDREKTTYHLNCINYDTQPEWELYVILYPMEITNEKKLELLAEAYADCEDLELVYSMIAITEDADIDGAHFNVTLTPEEQKIIFDLAGLDQYDQDLCLRLQNL